MLKYSTYLLLVTFYTGNIDDFTYSKSQALNVSPYNGVAISVVNAREKKSVSEIHIFNEVKRIKDHLKKDVWLWLYFNRFVGLDPTKNVSKELSEIDHSIRIKGIDLYDEEGGLSEFYKQWRISLRIARTFAFPGIVIDPEVYNNYKAYALSYVAERHNKNVKEIEKRLVEIGYELGRIANEEYPDATLWFLFSGLLSPLHNINPLSEKEYRTVTYIIRGILECAQKNNYKLKIVDGGEIALGYCHQSPQTFNKRIEDRATNYKHYLTTYHNLVMGGVVCPWDNYKEKKDWLMKGDCAKSELKSVYDFKPIFDLAFSSYYYIWIYAAKAANYNPYDLENAAKFNLVMNDSLKSMISLNFE